MKIQVEQKETCEALLTVEIDPPEVEAAMHKAAQRMSAKSNLPGFRKGKAPYSVVLTAYGEEAILDEALETSGRRRTARRSKNRRSNLRPWAR